MISKRKTIRFQDNLTDMSVYEALSNYRQYGFRSENHMVIEAVRRLICNDPNDLLAEKLADLIAERLSGKLMVSSGNMSASSSSDEATSSDAAFDAALSFLDSI
ncbi:MAG: hypothetical protein J6X66_02500 [Lachnospiraceae bacterium]|nr:hypothetical protein [Lachnospiraceae bacterium]